MMMTDLLRRAMERAQTLPESEQDQLGTWLLLHLLEHGPVEEIGAGGLAAVEDLAAQANVAEAEPLRPLQEVVAEYRRHGRFLPD